MLAKKRLIEATRPLSVVRGMIDPRGSLPDVRLRADDTHDPYDKLGQDGEPTYGYWIEGDGQTVGELLLAERPGSGEYHMADISVDHPGEGFGLAAYVLAIELAETEDTRFVADRLLSPDAVRIWQRLVSLGVATQYTPFEAADSSLPYDQQQYYTADIVIDPAEL